MSRDKFNDDCPGCRPTLVDPTTGRELADDHPVMQRLRRVWAATPAAERRAFHRFTCLNSRDPEDLRVMAKFTKRIEAEKN